MSGRRVASYYYYYLIGRDGRSSCFITSPVYLESPETAGGQIVGASRGRSGICELTQTGEKRTRTVDCNYFIFFFYLFIFPRRSFPRSCAASDKEERERRWGFAATWQCRGRASSSSDLNCYYLYLQEFRPGAAILY